MDPSTVQQMSNLQITDTVNESLPAIPVVPYDRLFPFLFPHIDQDKVDEIQALFEKYKRDEIIPKASFFRRVTDIVGMQLVYSATMQLPEQQKINRQILVNEQPRTQIDSSDLELPFDQLYPFLIPHIPDPDKVIELKVLFDKYRRGEIPNCNIIPLMKGIVGEPAFKSAVATLLRQKSNLQVTVNEQPRTQINSGKPVATFYDLYRLLAPQIGLDKRIDLYSLGEKYKRGEIPGSSFLPLMQGIVGESVFRSAAHTLLRQIRNKQFLRARLTRSMNAATDRSHNT